jgi:hypothetical protein
VGLPWQEGGGGVVVGAGMIIKLEENACLQDEIRDPAMYQSTEVLIADSNGLNPQSTEALIGDSNGLNPPKF